MRSRTAEMDALSISKTRMASLGLCGSAAAVVVSSVYLGYAWRQSEIEASMPIARASAQSRRQLRGDSDEEFLRQEQLSRNRQFFQDGQDKVEAASIVVVGVGGVGSHAAHMLARAGIRRLRVIDFDLVTLSSLNRHATADRRDVGRPKVEVLCERLRDIVPFVETEAIPRMFVGDAAEELLMGDAGCGVSAHAKPDLVLDCIDNTETKAELLLACERLDIPVVTALGAGGKADPTKIHLGPLEDAVHDPLAHRLRTQLRTTLARRKATPGQDERKIAEGESSSGRPSLGLSEEEEARVKRVLERTLAAYSSEIVRRSLLPLDPAQEANPDAYGAVAGFRIRIIPVLGTTPALMGMAMAANALCTLAGQPLEAKVERPSVSKSYLRKILNRLQRREPESATAPDICSSAVEYLVVVGWKHRCAATDVRIGMAGVFHELVRWDPEKPPVRTNLVLLTEAAAKELAEKGPTHAFDARVRARIAHRLAWLRAQEEQGDGLSLGDPMWPAPNVEPPRARWMGPLALLAIGLLAGIWSWKSIR